MDATSENTPDTPTGRRAAGGGNPTADSGTAFAARPLPTCDDYARWARMTPEQIARDCEVQVFRATGPGGQGVNTCDSAVRMRHVPSGTTVISRESRSQHQNRQTCLAKLAELFERRSHPVKKRAKTKVPRAQKERRLHAKHRVAQKKALRGRVGRGDD